MTKSAVKDSQCSVRLLTVWSVVKAIDTFMSQNSRYMSIIKSGRVVTMHHTTDGLQMSSL